VIGEGRRKRGKRKIKPAAEQNGGKTEKTA